MFNMTSYAMGMEDGHADGYTEGYTDGYAEGEETVKIESDYIFTDPLDDGNIVVEKEGE